MNKYSRASTLFFNSPLALMQSKIEEIRAFWESKFAGANLDFEDRQEPFMATLLDAQTFFSDDLCAEMLAAGTGSGTPTGGQIAIIPLLGIMAPRMNLMQAMSGGTSTSMFEAALREQVNNPQVRAIIIEVDSPGGSVYGTQELADAIWSLKGRKPIIAQIEKGVAASAAYWAISQCDEIIGSQSTELGHIGVATLLADRSGEAEQAGVKVLQVTAGKYKHEQTVGSDLFPWTDEQVGHVQQRVDEAYGMFVGSVARGREVKRDAVRNGFGEGRVVGIQEGISLGMADRIATLEQTIQRFASGGRATRRGASAEVETIIATGEGPPIEDEGFEGETVLEEFGPQPDIDRDRDNLAMQVALAEAGALS